MLHYNGTTEGSWWKMSNTLKYVSEEFCQFILMDHSFGHRILFIITERKGKLCNI